MQRFAEILGREASVPEPLDDVANQYCATKFRRHNHNREGLSKCVEVMLKRDSNADAELVVTPLQLISQVTSLPVWRESQYSEKTNRYLDFRAIELCSRFDKGGGSI